MNKPWTVSDLLTATGGKWVCGSRQDAFGSLCIDSRTITKDALFIAIVGTVHDGHRFAAAVAARGIRGVMVRQDRLDSLPVDHWRRHDIVCIAVPDTTKALGQLASFHQQRCQVSAVAITGSTGKTTTRAMTAMVLGRRFVTLATEGNLNNDIGLPLTLLRLTPDHQWAVVELGMNHPGEIRRLAAICRPELGLITNIGPAHLEGLGSMEAVTEAKAELIEQLSASATAILNADDPGVRQLARRHPGPVLFFGTGKDAQVRAHDIVSQARGIGFTLVVSGQSTRVHLPVPGRFMVINALAAAAVGARLDVPITEIGTALEAFSPVGHRMRIVEAGSIHIVDDAYNANPASMAAAISALMDVKGGSRAVFVAGDMKELGAASEALHEQLGAQVARCGLDRLCVTGGFAESVISGAVSQGFDPQRIMAGSQAEIIADLQQWLCPGDWVLIKGSRAMAMETVVSAIQTWAEKKHFPHDNGLGND
jgi:UDP-N-acetylmuramoyl-tripeptide--D-alanyl-D-alanine ligase